MSAVPSLRPESAPASPAEPAHHAIRRRPKDRRRRLIVQGAMALNGLLLIGFGAWWAAELPALAAAIALAGAWVFGLGARGFEIARRDRAIVCLPDAIAVPMLRGTTVIRRPDVVGHEVVTTQHGRFHVLHHVDRTGRLRRTTIDFDASEDLRLDRWTERLPGTDAMDRDARVTRDASGGGRTLAWVALAVAAWGAFVPVLAPLAVLANLLVPIVAIAMALLRPSSWPLFDDPAHARRFDRVLAVGAPGSALAWMLFTGPWVQPPLALVPAAVLATAAILGLLLARDRRPIRAPRRAVPAALAVAIWAFGTAGAINASFRDEAPWVEHVVAVHEQHEGRLGCRGTLRTAPWGAQERTRAEVCGPLVRAVPVGEPVCVREHRGGLGVDLYTVVHGNACLRRR